MGQGPKGIIRGFLGRPSQYGLEFHFGVHTVAEGSIVYNTHDGCVWARFESDRNVHGYDFSWDKAHRKCLEFNGHPYPAIEGIDSTP